MIVKDMMPGFELYQPTQLNDALVLLDRYGKDGWKMAGGNDSLSWFKERVKRPKAVIDISGIAALKGIRETSDGVEIGALTSLTEIERNPVIRAKYRVLFKRCWPERILRGDHGLLAMGGVPILRACVG